MLSSDVGGQIRNYANGNLYALPPVALSRDHIDEALAKSPDNGATLDLAHKDLTDVAESVAAELAAAGEDDGTGRAVVRYFVPSLCRVFFSSHSRKDCVGL